MKDEALLLLICSSNASLYVCSQILRIVKSKTCKSRNMQEQKANEAYAGREKIKLKKQG